MKHLRYSNNWSRCKCFNACFKFRKKKYKNICLIDTNTKLAPKIKVSGGAKCNITNELVSKKNYLGDRDFVEKLLNKFSKNDLFFFK